MQVRGLGRATAVFEVSGHVVEAADEFAELLGGGFGDAVAVVASRDGFHGVGEGFDRLGDLFGEVEGKPRAREERQAGEHQEQQHI